MDLVLIGVAVVAGVATFLSPCVLPVLPVVLAASANGGRRRPLGIAIGLAVAFVIFTLTASRLLMALGLPQDLLRNLAIAMLAVVGIALLVPAVATQAGTPLPPAGGRGRRASQRRRRVLVGRRAGRRAVAGVDAVRRADPGRGHGAERGEPRLARAGGDHRRLRAGRHGAVVRAGAARQPRGGTPGRCAARRPDAAPRRGGGAARDRGAVHDRHPDAACGRRPVLRLLAAAPGAVARRRRRPAGSDPVQRQLGRRGGGRPDAGSPARTTGRRRTSPTSPAWINTPGVAAAFAGGPARQGGAGRFLDLLVRELHPHAALPEAW